MTSRLSGLQRSAKEWLRKSTSGWRRGRRRARAGVVNIILEKNASGFDAQGTAGGYYKGDGFATDFSAGGGIALGKRGYLNLNVEFKHQDNTNRGGPDDRLGTRVDQFFGSSQETRETIEYDAGYDVTDNISLYSFATCGQRNG